MGDWEEWFAWYPVTLLTLEIAWLRTVKRRPSTGWQGGTWDYAN